MVMTYSLDVLLFLQTGNHAGSLDFVSLHPHGVGN